MCDIMKHDEVFLVVSAGLLLLPLILSVDVSAELRPHPHQHRKIGDAHSTGDAHLIPVH